MKVRARAPLRLGLAGGGTDLAPFADVHGGFVLNATIDLHSYAFLEPSADGNLHFKASDIGQSLVTPAVARIEALDKLPLHVGVYNRIVKDFCDGKPLPIVLSTYADVAPGSGLGSSSTLVVAMLKAFVEYLQLPLGEYEIAHLAFEIERIDLQMSGGRQDQYAATFGGFNFLEFGGNDRVIVNPLRVKRWVISELESSTVLFYTTTQRNSSNVIDRQVERMQTQHAASMDALFAMKQDAVDMKAALLRGRLSDFAEILGRSWEHKKRTADGVSNDALDRIYESAKGAGAVAGKVSGAGGGGFMMFIVDPTRRASVVESLRSQNGVVMTCNFSEHGTEGWRID